jgi:hypothetical protein
LNFSINYGWRIYPNQSYCSRRDLKRFSSNIFYLNSFRSQIKIESAIESQGPVVICQLVSSLTKCDGHYKRLALYVWYNRGNLIWSTYHLFYLRFNFSCTKCRTRWVGVLVPMQASAGSYICWIQLVPLPNIVAQFTAIFSLKLHSFNWYLYLCILVVKFNKSETDKSVYNVLWISVCSCTCLRRSHVCPSHAVDNHSKGLDCRLAIHSRWMVSPVPVPDCSGTTKKLLRCAICNFTSRKCYRMSF